MVWAILILGATLFIAYANGANDNFKGVATLFGSGTTTYRKALGWATATTLAGSLTAVFFAVKLIKTFSGKGLVPDALIANPVFMASVILGAGLTVFFAAKMGIPISTTHGLLGALFGSGLVAAGGALGFGTLGKNFVLPLLASPFIAMALTAIAYLVLRFGRKHSGIKKSTCVCVGEKWVPVGSLAAHAYGAVAADQLRLLDVVVDDKSACEAKAMEFCSGKFLGIQAQQVLDCLHFVSAGAVSFARGLNDTPKIVALLVTAGALGLRWNVALVAAAMALGGILGAKKVAKTVSHRVTKINHGQGFTANLITAFLVIVASRWGMPVSTTHVSCGSLFGIGAVNGKANWKTIQGILYAWVLTLPVAAAFSGATYLLLRAL